LRVARKKKGEVEGFRERKRGGFLKARGGGVKKWGNKSMGPGLLSEVDWPTRKMGKNPGVDAGSPQKGV